MQQSNAVLFQEGTLGKIGEMLRILKTNLLVVTVVLLAIMQAEAQDRDPSAVDQAWKASKHSFQPIWENEICEGETVLFLQDENGDAKGQLLFPVEEILAIHTSDGSRRFELNSIRWKQGARELVVPKGSVLPTYLPSDLRRPANSQRHALTHRDGNGEILFGGELEYAAMQICISYRHRLPATQEWFPRKRGSLPKTRKRLMNDEGIHLVVLGDSISAGYNASGMFSKPPFQPAYPGLLKMQLEQSFKGQIQLTNLSISGKDTAWGLSQMEEVIKLRPHLVVIAFGMNDSAGRSKDDYQEKTRQMMRTVREALPECEIILVAPMLGNRDWTRLKHERFPEYQQALIELADTGVAVADVTRVWTRMLDLKADHDLTGNGVNHPNDFGHRIYAQVISQCWAP